jgi:peroxidase
MKFIKLIDPLMAGAHTLGTARCGTFQYRLANDQDKGMNATFRSDLRRQCSNNAITVVPLDAGSQYGFDVSFYANVLANKTLLQSDAALNSPPTVARVRQLRNDPSTFMRSFEVSMGRMGALRGSNPGKVRDSCRKVRT